MSEVVVAALMWLVVLCVGVSRQGDSDRSVLISSSAIAFALTLNIDPLYFAGDAILGGANRLELVSDLALMIGISFLLRAVLRATRGARNSRVELVAMTTLIAVCVAIALTFTQISAKPTSTTFMRDFGNQTAAAAYSMIQFAYVGSAMMVMGRVAIRHSSELVNSVARASLRIVSAGCVAAIILSATIIGMDITHLVGAHFLLAALSAAYEPLYLAAIVMLCVGFSAPPMARRLDRLRRHNRTKVLVQTLSPAWSESVDFAIAIPVERYAEGPFDSTADSLEFHLHRMIVELRDAATKTKTDLPFATTRLLVEAESHLAANTSLKVASSL